MHGLVCIGKNNQPIRNAIIWCDSRAVEIGNKAFVGIGEEKCLAHLLNSPGNFTASKLAWVKNNEPELYARIEKIMLPGDFIAMQFTGTLTTTAAALSEGVFWDFANQQISNDVLNYYGLDRNHLPNVQEVFSTHGTLKKEVAEMLQLPEGIPVTYKAGDQPNNALSLNVSKHGEVAATAGTSGVIYGVSEKPAYDKQSRVNSFAHVNYTTAQPNTGILLCVNGCGILNRYIKDNMSKGLTYEQMNAQAAEVGVGSDGLSIMPFGNGAERMLNNKIIGTSFHNLDVNRHTASHIFRAAQEGIAFALHYGLTIMKNSCGVNASVIRVGHANMFLSKVFTEAFVNVTGVPLELYKTDGSIGAALGAGIGAGIYNNMDEAFSNLKCINTVTPEKTLQEQYAQVYKKWEIILQDSLRMN
jgi:xylulokinase